MKNLLIISSSFPPNSIISAKRPSKLAQHISKFGWNPFVLTCASGCYYEVDPLLEKDIPSGVLLEKVRCRSLWAHIRILREKYPNGIQRFAIQLLSAITKITQPMVPLDERYPWALQAAKQGILLVRQHTIDLLWATSPHISNLYAAYLIAMKTGVPYILDYRDVSMEVKKNKSFLNRYNSRLEHTAVRNAAGISYVAPMQEQILLKKFSCAAEKPRCLIYNWFDASKTTRLHATKNNHFTIIHGGSLYRGTRKIDYFFEALSLIKKSPLTHLQQVKFYQYFYHEGMNYLEEIRSRYNLEDTVSFCKKVTYDTFLSLCKGADILLLVVGHDTEAQQHAGTIPGKLYDYFAACKPILVIGPSYCEAASMVTKLNRGLAVPDDNPGQIAEAINLLAQQRGKNGALDLSMNAVREFESETVVEKMARFFDEVAPQHFIKKNRT